MAKAVNVFGKGLHQDNEEQFQPPQTYRDARNVRIINEGKNFSFVSEKGMSISFSVTDIKFKPIGGIEGDGKLYVLSAADNPLLAGDWGEIGEVTIDYNAGTGTYQALYNHSTLNFLTENPIPPTAIKFNKENDGKKRLYWSDFNEEPRVLNVANPKLTDTKTTAAGQIEVGKSYMVVEDTAVYNGTTYGPFQAAGNVFTRDTAADPNAYTVGSGTPRVIEYIPVEILSWNPDRNLSPIYFNRFYDSGTVPAGFNTAVPCGAYLVTYRLKRKDESAITPWVAPSNFVYVGQEDIVDGINSYATYQGDKEISSSNKALEFKVENIDPNFDQIEVAIVQYIGKNVFNPPEIFFSDDIPASETFIYDGTNGISTFSSDDIIQVFRVFKKLRTFEEVESRNVGGNYEIYGDLDDFDPSSGVTIDKNLYEVTADRDAYSRMKSLAGVGAAPLNIDSGGSPIIGVARAQDPIAPTTGELLPMQWYKVNGTYSTPAGTDDATTVTAGNTYPVGAVFQNGAAVDTHTVNGTAELVACLVIKNFDGGAKTTTNLVVGRRYVTVGGSITHDGWVIPQDVSFIARATTFTGAGTVEEFPARIVEIVDDFYDMKGMAVGSNLKGYWRGETYRFGILPYDKKGNPMFVRWIGDYTVPNIDDDSSVELILDYNTNTDFNLNLMGVEISGLDLSDIVDPNGNGNADESKISGFSIVVAPRKKKAIAQGLLMQVFPHSGGTSANTDFCPEAWVSSQGDVNFAGNGGDIYGYYIVHSPDLMFNNSAIPDDASIEVVNYMYDPIGMASPTGTTYDLHLETGNVTGNGPLTLQANNIAFFIKRYERRADTGDTALGTTFDIKQFKTLGPNVQGSLFDDDNPTFKMYGQGTLDTLAIPNSALGDNLNGYESRNGKGMILVLDTKTSVGSWGATESQRMTVNIISGKGTGSYSEKSVQEYITTGHYQPINDEVYSQNGDSWTFDGIEVWGGDTFVSIFDFVRWYGDTPGGAFYINRADSPGQSSYAIGEAIAVESEVNVNLRRGRNLNRDRTIFNTAAPTGVSLVNDNGLSINKVENFIVDEFYNSSESPVEYPALPNNFDENKIYDIRAAWSNIKFNGEEIDNFRLFLANNFKDLQSENESITGLLRRRGRLYAWQEFGWSYLPINERALTPDPLGNPIQLGTGGILERFDELSERYGCQDPFSIVKTQKGFAWVDQRKMAVINAVASGGVIEISTLKGLHEFIRSNIFRKQLGINDNNEYQVAIKSGYNEQFNEVLVSFYRFQEKDQVGVELDNFAITIAFNEFTSTFTAFYDWVPGVYMNFFNYLLSTPCFDRPEIQPNELYSAFNDIVIDSNTNDHYMALNDFLTLAVPSQPSTDAVNWAKISSNNEVYLHNVGDICKFHGAVFPEFIEIIVNQNQLDHKVFDNIILKGNDEMFDTVTYSDSYQTSVETSADTSFRFRKRKWHHSIKRNDADQARMRDTYLKIRFSKTHRPASDPTVSDDTVLKLVSLETIFRESK